MTKYAASALVLATIVVGFGLGQPFVAQDAPSLANATMTHVGVTVRDIEAAARGYADIFGIPVPEIQTVTSVQPDGSTADLKVANVPLPNFSIQLLQPITESGPVHDHLEQFGIGVDHLAFSIDSDLDQMRVALVQIGGRWTGGEQGGGYALIDFRERLGAAIEIVRGVPPATSNAPSEETGLFGGRPLRHIGLAVSDVDETIAAYADVLGTARTQATRFPPEPGPFPFPPGIGWNTDAYVMVTQLQHSGIGIELIQSIGGPTPWTDFVEKQRGPAIQHLAVGRGSLSREDWLRIGQEKGGKWTNGGPPPDGTFAYLDFSEILGLTFE